MIELAYKQDFHAYSDFRYTQSYQYGCILFLFLHNIFVIIKIFAIENAIVLFYLSYLVLIVSLDICFERVLMFNTGNTI